MEQSRSIQRNQSSLLINTDSREYREDSILAKNEETSPTEHDLGLKAAASTIDPPLGLSDVGKKIVTN